MANPNKILQWNCRGLKPNFDEINLLLNDHNPIAFCLQETFLKDSDTISFKKFNMFNHICTTGEKASGGVSILINRKIPHSSVSLNTTLQATAVKVTMHRELTICSLYLPPSLPIDSDKLDDLVKQLPSPFLILGDFNAHNHIWGSDRTDARGKLIEQFILKNNTCIFNTTKSHTYLHPASGSYTSIDLSICDPTTLLDFSWRVGDDLCGSDHFPIFLENIGPPLLENLQKWKLRKADWNSFQALCASKITSGCFDDVEDPIDTFSSLLHSIADETIPKTSANPKRPNKPWFDEDCKQAIKQRKSALNKFDLRPTSDNLNNFLVFRAKARRTIKLSKRKSWQTYVSKLNSRSSIKKTWDMVRKISGKGHPSSVNHLKTVDGDVTSVKDIVDTLADTFSKHSSSENYSKKFQNHKKKAEKKKLNFTSNNSENYNKPFSLSELKQSLNKSHDTSAGPDDIHYQLLKHLPPSSLSALLDLFNRIWESGNFPPSWREAIVIPIPKAGKDHTNPVNYRPIALTSCICKTMERMINERLVWYLESNGLITEFQSGFRRQRGTIDHLVRFESFIRDAFIKKEHLVSVFFDLEKAYDTTWKYGIMNDLSELGLKGRLPNFISNFLDDRQFKVRVGSTLSDAHKQEMGVPQGSILSVTLFSIKINNIVKNINPGVDCSLYVDDFVICYRSKNMNTIERQLQQCLNKLQTWSDENGFKFSKSKTNVMHFCQLRKHHADPHLTLDGSVLPVVEETKFLGLLFDRKFTFIPHLKYLKAKCLKALNLLRVVGSTDWGADRKVMLRLYRSLIRSKLDYGSIVYGSACKSHLQMLDPVHNQGLRLALGAFRTSPAESLYVEANEPSLSQRRDKLSLQYITKLKSNPTNPAYSVVFDPNYKDVYSNKPKAIPSFGIRMEPKMKNTQVDLNLIAEYKVPETPPWTLEKPTVIFDLTSQRKSNTDSLIFQSKFNELKSKYPHHSHIYTDGSKDGKVVASAAVLDEQISKSRLPDGASIFSAELRAILLALDMVERSTNDKFVIFSDSLSSLQALDNLKVDNPTVQRVLSKYNSLSDRNTVLFCWLPSHVGIRGNDQADSAAKAALNLDISPSKLPYTDFKGLINESLKSSWQSAWDAAITNKLHSVKPVLGEWLPSFRTNRREEVVLARCRIGHTRYTHSFLFQGEEPPECIPCAEPLSVKHILIDCVDFVPMRQRYYTVTSMRDLFDRITPNDIFDFLKEINLYHKL